MIVDPSAIMAILLKEPGREAFARAIILATSVRLSAGGWIELAAVLTRVGRAELFPTLTALLAEFDIEIVPVTTEQAHIGHEAYRHYGLGRHNPARLNFGDCFSYALAKATGQPLLFKGDDFTYTDIVAVL